MEAVNKYVTLLTFIPWVLIYVKSIVDNLKNDNYKKFSVSYLKKHFFKVFRLDILFLIIVFFYFSSFKMDFVDKYLFLVMCIYMFVNNFYEEHPRKQKDFYKNNLVYFILLFVISLVPFLVYIIKQNVLLTYKIMLLYLFLEYIIILLVSYLIKLGKKVFKKK